ncbi:MAG: PAS domain S-box protein [Bacteroidia bacterium]|nr:PAS domain S-box protein [Bacteroidia bacterium]
MRYQKKAQKEKLELILEYEKHIIEMSLSNRIKLIEDMARSNELKIYSERYIEPIIFQYFVSFEKNFPSLTYVNKNGMEEVKVVEQIRSWNLKNINDSIYLKNALKNPNKVIISPVKYNEDLKMLAIEFIIANYEYFGDELNFIIFGSVPLYDITKNISNLKIGESGFAVLIDIKGNILSLSKRNDIIKTILVENKKDKIFIKKVEALQNGFERVNVMGIDSLTAYSPINGMEWALMIAMPYDEFMVLPNTLKNTIILISIIIFIVGAQISLFLSKSITKPIKDLVSVTFEVASGNFSKRTNILSNDEIGTLSESFNKMTENLEKTTVSKDYFDSIIKNMSDILIVADKDFNIMTINKAGIDLLGYSINNIIDKPLFDFIDKNEFIDSASSVKIVTNEEFKNFEVNIKIKGGKSTPSLFSTSVIKDKEGQIKYFICTAKDITERKKAEMELREYTKKIEYINRELDTYTYIVSHDLKEPLRSINAFSRFIEDDYADKIDPSGKNYLERIRINTVRIQSIVEDFLEFSNIEKKIINFENVDVKKVLDDIKLKWDEKVKNMNGEIVIHNEIPVIFCDRTGLADIFGHLVSNAVKFADKDTLRIEIGSSEENGFYKFYVKDNGMGIEEKYFKKIFGIFQRLIKREEKKGTGVGLAIAKKIVEIHKGKIWVESKHGEGSVFYFLIPKNKDVILNKKGEIYAKQNN